MSEFWEIDSRSGGYRLEARAAIALSLLERWALVAARDDGEDSAGRQKIHLSEPAEAVERAFALADAFVDEALKRGAIRQALEPEEIGVIRGRAQHGEIEGRGQRRRIFEELSKRDEPA